MKKSEIRLKSENLHPYNIHYYRHSNTSAEVTLDDELIQKVPGKKVIPLQQYIQRHFVV